jgi:hypothetical protein
MPNEEIGCSVPPPVSGIIRAQGDPNFTVTEKPHFDLIRTKLLEAMKNESLPLEDRESAKRAFNQMYPASKATPSGE